MKMTNNGNLISDLTALIAVFALSAYGVLFLANAANLL
jgi:hypothetical protein